MYLYDKSHKRKNWENETQTTHSQLIASKQQTAGIRRTPESPFL